MTRSMRYDAVAVMIHWLTVLAILCLLALGWIMTDLKPGSALQFTLFQWHKSIGVTVLALTLIRCGWRLAHRPPPLPPSMPAWEARAAKAGHLALYALLVAVPVSGWAVVSASPLNLPTVLYGVIPFPHLPVLPTLPDKKAVEAVLKEVHETGVSLLLAMLAVHVGAALRHHVLLRDDVLVRMLPRFGRPI